MTVKESLRLTQLKPTKFQLNFMLTRSIAKNFNFPGHCSTPKWEKGKNHFLWANPGLFFIYFRLFKHTLQFLQQINVKKCPFSIQCQHSYSRPLEHKSPPIATRPGLPPIKLFLIEKLIRIRPSLKYYLLVTENMFHNPTKQSLISC